MMSQQGGGTQYENKRDDRCPVQVLSFIVPGWVPKMDISVRASSPLMANEASRERAHVLLSRDFSRLP